MCFISVLSCSELVGLQILKALTPATSLAPMYTSARSSHVTCTDELAPSRAQTFTRIYLKSIVHVSDAVEDCCILLVNIVVVFMLSCDMRSHYLFMRPRPCFIGYLCRGLFKYGSKQTRCTW